MIRKPSAADFRESTAVTAARATRKIAVEASGGVGQGVARLYTYWFVGIMGFGFVASLLPYLGFPGFLLIVGGVVCYFNHQKKRKAGLGTSDPSVTSRAVPHPLAWEAQEFAFPADVRRAGRVELNISAVSQQAVVLGMAGLLTVAFFARLVGSEIVTILGIALILLGVLVAARLFGNRAVLEWDTQRVKVRHLLSEGEMQWSDVADVRVEKSSRFNPETYFLSGSSRNIVLAAPVNRLGGPAELLVPIRLLGLERQELELVLRDLFCWRAAGNSIAKSGMERAQAGAQADGGMAEPARSGLANPRASFVADAIMARYLAEREQVIAAARPDLHSHASARPVFGRKVV